MHSDINRRLPFVIAQSMHISWRKLYRLLYITLGAHHHLRSALMLLAVVIAMTYTEKRMMTRTLRLALLEARSEPP